MSAQHQHPRNPRTPQDIAADMAAQAEKYVSGKTSIDEHITVTDSLWSEANSLGAAVAKRVGVLLCAAVAKRCAEAQPRRLPKFDRARIVAEVRRPENDKTALDRF